MSDLTQELVNNSVKALQDSNLYIANNDSNVDFTNVKESYANSKIGIVVTNKETLTYYDTNNVAQQLLNSNKSYENIILVADGKYGAAGKNSGEILKILNSNNTSDPAQTLINSSSNIIKVNEVKTSTVTQSHSGSGANYALPIAGGGILVLIAGFFALKSIMSKNNKNISNNTEKITEIPLTLNDKQVMLRRAISEWNSLNNNPNTEKFDVKELTETSKEIVNHWSEIDNAMAKNNAERIISEEIPKILSLYYSLPEVYQHKRLASGLTPNETVQEQLTIMNDSLKETIDAVYSGKISELEIQSVFIRDKYKNNFNNLTLDE